MGTAGTIGSQTVKSGTKGKHGSKHHKKSKPKKAHKK
jgi:hypothetical protein